MHLLLELLATAFLLVGLAFFLVGAIGIVRLPDVFMRLHAASKCSTLGLLGMLVAACLALGTDEVAAKAIAVIVFTAVATPIGSHLLAKAALETRQAQWDRTLGDEHADDGIPEA